MYRIEGTGRSHAGNISSLVTLERKRHKARVSLQLLSSYPILFYGFGMCMLLLTIAQPHPMKMPTIGCTLPPHPKSQTPPKTPRLPPSTIPLQTHQAMPDTMPKEVGIGVPSKYLLLPVLSLGREETVTLKRARRVSPQRTKKERNKVSSGVRRPRAKAHTAGATPNEIWAGVISIDAIQWGGCMDSAGAFLDLRMRTDRMNTRKMYQICQRVQFLSH